MVFCWVPSLLCIHPSISYVLFISRCAKLQSVRQTTFIYFFFPPSWTALSEARVQYATECKRVGDANRLGEILCFYHHQFSIQFSLSLLVSLLSFIFFSFYMQGIICKFFFVFVKWFNIINARFYAPFKFFSVANFYVRMWNLIYQTFGYMQSSLFKINVLIPAFIVWLLCISEFRRWGAAHWSASA